MDKKNISKYLIIGFITIVVIFVVWISGVKKLIDNIEVITYDWRSQFAVDTGNFNSKFKKASKDIIILAADDYTSQNLEKYPQLEANRWPWPRKTWGDVVNFINLGKPKAVIFDIKFEGAEGKNIDNIKSDKHFAEAIKRTDNVILAVALTKLNLKNKEYKNIPGKKFSDYNDMYSYIFKYLNADLSTVRKKHTYSVDDSQIRTFNKNNRTLLNAITYSNYSAIENSLLENTDHIGVINLKSSENMIARYNTPLYRLVSTNGIVYMPSLPLAAVLSLLPEKERTPFKFERNKIIIGKRIIPVEEDGKTLISWHGHRKTYTHIPVIKVMLTDAYKKGLIRKVDNNDLISPEIFKDKIVLIGQTSAGTDIHPTPMDMIYPGTEIIATVLDNYLYDSDTTNPLARKFITKAPFWLNFLITILFCLAIGAFNIKTRSIYLSISWFILLVSMFILISNIAFAYPTIRIWINMTYPLIFMSLTETGTYLYRLHVENKEKKAVEGLFGKFVSPQVLKKLLDDPKSISREGQRKIMTVLFSDIRGFTSLSESVPAQEIIPQLNEYLTEMVEVILKYNGTLDKYMGDAVMAFYGDPLPMEDHSLRAVLTAIDMQKSLEKLNAKWQTENKPRLSIGIGINTGEMIVGHIGSPRLVDYTVIGDNVNLASRIEGLTKNYNNPIIISETTYNDVKEYIDAEYLDECTVKGKQKAIKVYGVKGINIEKPHPILTK